MRFCFFILLSLFPLSALPVTLQQSADTVTVRNEHFTASFEKNTGYALRFTGIGNRKMSYALGNQTVLLDNDLEKYEERYCPAPTPLDRRTLKPSIKILDNSADCVKLEISYAFPGGKSREIVEITNDPAILFDVSVDHKVRLFANRFQLAVNGGSADGIFLNDGKRVTGVWGGSGYSQRKNPALHQRKTFRLE